MKKKNEHDNEHNSREIINGRLIPSYKLPKRFTSSQNTLRIAHIKTQKISGMTCERLEHS